MRSQNRHFYTQGALQRNTASKFSEISVVNSATTYLSYNTIKLSHASIVTLRLQGLVYDDSSLLRPKAVNTLFCSRPFCSMHVEHEWDICMCAKICFHLPSVAGGAMVEIDPVINPNENTFMGHIDKDSFQTYVHIRLIYFSKLNY